MAVRAARINWGEGENLVKLTAAVNEWIGKSGRFLSEDNMEMKRFCFIVGIPKSTFKKYVCADVTKRRTLGASVGPTAAVDADAA